MAATGVDGLADVEGLGGDEGADAVVEEGSSPLTAQERSSPRPQPSGIGDAVVAAVASVGDLLGTALGAGGDDNGGSGSMADPAENLTSNDIIVLPATDGVAGQPSQAQPDQEQVQEQEQEQELEMVSLTDDNDDTASTSATDTVGEQPPDAKQPAAATSAKRKRHRGTEKFQPLLTQIGTVLELAQDLLVNVLAEKPALEQYYAPVQNIVSCLRLFEMECPRLARAAIEHDSGLKNCPGNGFRSLLYVVRCAINQVGESLTYLKQNHHKRSFRSEWCLKQLTTRGLDVLKTLIRIVSLAAKLAECVQPDNLFLEPESPEYAHYRDEFLTEVTKMTRDSFYGNSLGFYYAEPIQRVLKTIGFCLAGYHQGFVHGTSLLLAGSRMLFSSTEKNKKLVDAVLTEDIGFTKAFWNLVDTTPAKHLAKVIAPWQGINVVFDIAISELDTANGGASGASRLVLASQQTDNLSGPNSPVMVSPDASVCFTPEPSSCATSPSQPADQGEDVYNDTPHTSPSASDALQEKAGLGSAATATGESALDGSAMPSSGLFEPGLDVAALQEALAPEPSEESPSDPLSQAMREQEAQSKAEVKQSAAAVAAAATAAPVKQDSEPNLFGHVRKPTTPAGHHPDAKSQQPGKGRGDATSLTASAPYKSDGLSASKERGSTTTINSSDDWVFLNMEDHKTIRVRLISYRQRVGQITSNKMTTSVKGAEPAAGLIVHFHGGGFVAQSSQSHEVYLRRWAKDLDVPILSVDYSLAPEHPYPTPMEECFFAYRWARANARKLGSTGRYVCIAGDSAGGNLAVAVGLRCVQEGIALPTGILASYPALNLKFSPSASRLLSVIDPILPQGVLKTCLKAYTGHDPMDFNTDDPLLSPLCATPDLLNKLPPIYLLAAGLDPLLDDSIQFARKLRLLKRPVRLTVFPHLPHGFLCLPRTNDEMQKANDHAVKCLRSIVAPVKRQASANAQASKA